MTHVVWSRRMCKLKTASQETQCPFTAWPRVAFQSHTSLPLVCPMTLLEEKMEFSVSYTDAG